MDGYVREDPDLGTVPQTPLVLMNLDPEPVGAEPEDDDADGFVPAPGVDLSGEEIPDDEEEV